jgi:replicative DNA helicase
MPAAEPTETLDRIPPHDLDAEAAVLSSVLIDASALDKVEDLLRPEHFFAESHTWIYRAAQALRQDDRPVDVATVGTWLRDCSRLAQVGGMAYITEVLNAAPAVLNVRAYAETVVDKAMARRVIGMCQKYQALGYSNYGTATEYVGAVSRSVHEIATDSERAEASPLHEIIAKNICEAQAAAQRGNGILGLATGFDRYDRITSGLHDGELTIVAARPGMGKTSLALQMAMFVAGGSDIEGHQNAVGFFSLEMPKAQLGVRALCSDGKVDVGRFRTGKLTATDWQRLTASAGRLNFMPLSVDDQSALSIVQLRAKARRMQTAAALAGNRLRLIVVDYLQLMNGNGESSREQEVSFISRGLKQLSKELGLPIIALSQLNRAVETRGEKSKRPQLSDLRESGAIEQDADNVVFIYRDDYYHKDSPDRGIAEIIIEKQRNGPTDTVKVRFDAYYTRFENLPDGGDSEHPYA